MKRKENKLGTGRFILMCAITLLLGYLASDLASAISRGIRAVGTNLRVMQVGSIVSILAALTVIAIMIVKKRNPMTETGSFVAYALALSLLAFAARLLNS